MAFGDSFSSSFEKSAAVAGAGAIDIMKEKMKQNDEARKSSFVIDSLESRIVENALRDKKSPEDISALSKSFDALRKAKLTASETLTVAKTLDPSLFNDKAPMDVYVQGNDGSPRKTGTVPGGSKVFKEALTPEQLGARTVATETAKFDAVKETAARAFDLRKEFQSIPEVKDYQVIKGQVSSMDALLKNVRTGDGDSALALDQGLITLFNKITDPRSVVRESEYERTPQNLSLFNRFGGAFEKLKQGGAGLTESDREALVFGAKVIADSRADIYNETVSNYENLANEFGVNPTTVISGFGKAEKFVSDNTPSFKTEQEAIKAGRKKGDRVKINGVMGTLI